MESSEYDSIMDRYWVGVGAGLLVSISALGSSPVARAYGFRVQDLGFRVLGGSRLEV